MIKFKESLKYAFLFHQMPPWKREHSTEVRLYPVAKRTLPFLQLQRILRNVEVHVWSHSFFESLSYPWARSKVLFFDCTQCAEFRRNSILKVLLYVRRINLQSNRVIVFVDMISKEEQMDRNKMEVK